MPVKLVDLTDDLENIRTHKIFDDFDVFVTTDLWTSVLTDSGTAADGDAVNGILTLTASDGSVADNDEAYVKTTQETFIYQDKSNMVAQCRLKFTEANTDDANVFFGFSDAIAANTIVDNGAGLKTSGSMACIYKVDGGTAWKCLSSSNTTQTISTSSTDRRSGSWETLRIEVNVTDQASDIAEVTFYVNGVQLKDSTTGLPIKHRVDYTTSTTEMGVGAGVKNGSANNESLLIDYIYAAQVDPARAEPVT